MPERMRVTYHNARTRADGSAFSPRHNDRDFTLENAANIDADRTIDNLYWNCFAGWYTEAERESQTHTFYEAERDYYQMMFGDAYLAQQMRHERARNYSRMKTFDEWIYETRQNMPVETYLQIGKSGNGNHPPYRIMRECGDRLLERLSAWSESHNNCIQILDVAYHFDEEVPQMHVRRVFQCADDDGVMVVNQSRALEIAGVEYDVDAAIREGLSQALSRKRKKAVDDAKRCAQKQGRDLSKDEVKAIRSSVTLSDDEIEAIKSNPKPTRHANRLMTFDSMVRQWWMDICEEHGIEVERTPLPPHKSKSKEVMLWEREIKVMDEDARVTRAREDVERQRIVVEAERKRIDAERKSVERERDDVERRESIMETKQELQNDWDNEFDEKKAEADQYVADAKSRANRIVEHAWDDRALIEAFVKNSEARLAQIESDLNEAENDLIEARSEAVSYREVLGGFLAYVGDRVPGLRRLCERAAKLVGPFLDDMRQRNDDRRHRAEARARRRLPNAPKPSPMSPHDASLES